MAGPVSDLGQMDAGVEPRPDARVAQVVRAPCLEGGCLLRGEGKLSRFGPDAVGDAHRATAVRRVATPTVTMVRAARRNGRAPGGSGGQLPTRRYPRRREQAGVTEEAAGHVP